MRQESEPKTSGKKRAVVCLSGGMDSATCAALAAQQYEAYALHFSYGQRTERRELEAARAVAQALHFREFLPLNMDLFRRIGGSALTDPSIAMPAARHNLSQPDKAVPVTYVPFRNAHFLAAAVSWAEVLDAEAVFIGAVEPDSSGYPDCRPVYYDAFRELVRTGTRDGNIKIETPLIHLRKSEIVRLALECGAPLDLTWSCYTGDEVACGECESCLLRRAAFAQAGVEDPIRYAVAAT